MKKEGCHHGQVRIKNMWRKICYKKGTVMQNGIYAKEREKGKTSGKKA